LTKLRFEKGGVQTDYTQPSDRLTVILDFGLLSFRPSKYMSEDKDLSDFLIEMHRKEKINLIVMSFFEKKYM